ncbi:MAG: PIG-L family deacetylase [Flavobacteriales bacterium]|nr:PIG-L family deacetylase [Flavobacteriales bacterium]
MLSNVSSTARLLAVALAFPFSGLFQNTFAQRPANEPDAAHILHDMEKLPMVGAVLYIAAHPDDENTKLIAWLSNGKKVRTGYLSLTRGDGGQDLLGPELGDALGIIRTEELLAARRIDGGEQFFTRASDFGYSKNAKESFEKWGHDEVLSDVVRVIRTFRPDVIITRFPPTNEAGHGHHEASAILAHEAFDMAGDPEAFPEQLEQGLTVWQPRRLYFNGSTWWKKIGGHRRAEQGLVPRGRRRLRPLAGPELYRACRPKPQHAQEPGLRCGGDARRADGIPALRPRRPPEKRRHLRRDRHDLGTGPGRRGRGHRSGRIARRV